MICPSRGVAPSGKSEQRARRGHGGGERHEREAGEMVPADDVVGSASPPASPDEAEDAALATVVVGGVLHFLGWFAVDRPSGEDVAQGEERVSRVDRVPHGVGQVREDRN